LDDIARSLGVHRSTISLALRNSPKIPEATRARIQTEAKRLGYKPNPLVTALMRTRRSGGEAKDVTLAYVTNYPTRFGWRREHTGLPDYFRGATARAEELGYKLDHFWLGEPGMTPKRMSTILETRGIHGIIVGRLPAGQVEITLRWELFSSVSLGMTLQHPNLHRVSEDFFAGASAAMRQVLGRGYRRVGFVFAEPDDCARVSDQWMSAFMWNQSRTSAANLIPPFMYVRGDDNARRFQKWRRETKPDVLLATHAPKVADWLQADGLHIPEDIGLASLNNESPDCRWSGIYCCPDRLGGLAAEMLIGQMHRCETGIPPDPHEVLLCGRWMEGETLRPC
jgi:LacI family transcriptional regulator